MANHDLNLIAARRSDVVGMIEQYRKHITELESELAELDITGKVMARLTGAKWHTASAADGSRQAVPRSASDTQMTMPEMVIDVLTDAHRQGVRDLSPKDIYDRMAEKFGFSRRSDTFASIVWRVWKQGRIERASDGRYRIPQEKEASDQLSLGDGSEASDSTPAQGGEPVREVVHDKIAEG